MQENGTTAVFMTDSISEALAIGGRIAVPGRPATPAYDVGALRTGASALHAPAAL
jgi:NitT/TauT family transport system ATP-binding protein